MKIKHTSVDVFEPICKKNGWNTLDWKSGINWKSKVDKKNYLYFGEFLEAVPKSLRWFYKLKGFILNLFKSCIKDVWKKQEIAANLKGLRANRHFIKITSDADFEKLQKITSFKKAEAIKNEILPKPFEKEPAVPNLQANQIEDQVNKTEVQDPVPQEQERPQEQAQPSLPQSSEIPSCVAPTIVDPIVEEVLTFNFKEEYLPVEYGFSIDRLNEKQKDTLKAVIKNWVNREDHDTNPWSHEALAKVLKLKLENVHELFYRLQVLPKTVTTGYLDWLFGSFVHHFTLLTPKQTRLPESYFMSGAINFKWMFKGESVMMAFDRDRFAGIRAKQEWNLKDLSMYFAIDEADLGRILAKALIGGGDLLTLKDRPEILEEIQHFERPNKQMVSARFYAFGEGERTYLQKSYLDKL